MSNKHTYQIGDKVTIIDDLEGMEESVGVDDDDWSGVDKSMLQYQGQEATITNPDSHSGWIRINLDEGEFYWSSQMIVQQEHEQQPISNKG